MSSPKTNLIDFIAMGEANSDNYNSANNGTNSKGIVPVSGLNLTNMTVADVMRLQKGTRGTGRQLFAAGRYQIIPSTMKVVVRGMGINPEKTMFDEKIQDQMAEYLMTEKRPVVGSFLRGEHDDIDHAMIELAKEWASFPIPSTGKSYYGGANAASHSVDEVRAMLQAERERRGSVPTENQQIAQEASQRLSAPTPEKGDMALAALVPPDLIENTAEVVEREARQFAGNAKVGVNLMVDAADAMVKLAGSDNLNLVPSNVVAFGKYTLRSALSAIGIGVGPGEYDEGILSENDMARLKQVVQRNKGKGVGYRDWGYASKSAVVDDLLNSNVARSFFDSDFRLATLLGQARVVEENGNVYVVDTYNFNPGPLADKIIALQEAGEEKEVDKLYSNMSWLTYLRVRAAVNGMKVDEGELNVRINLGPVSSVYGGAPRQSQPPRARS